MAKTPLFRRLKRLASQTLPLAELTRGEPEQARRLSRRKLFGAGAAAGLLGCSPEAPPAVGPTKPAVHRIAVIGAGLAGLHCAYRLAQSNAEVTVYEANTRVGGRIFTTPVLRENPKVICELGGEFIDSQHQAMLALISEFGLRPEDRLADSAGIAGDVFWFRGKSVGQDVIDAQFASVAPAMAKALSAANREPSAFRELDSTPLANWLGPNVPSDEYPELSALLKAAFTSEFGLDPDEQSALNLLFLLGSADLATFKVHGSSDRRSHILGGNAALTRKLSEALKARVQTDARLVRIESVGTATSPLYSLSFQSQAEVPMHAEAERVVFALPFSVLAQVELGGLGLSDGKQTVIRELGYGTGSKLVGAFVSRVWRDLHQSGHVISDLGFQELWDTSIGQLTTQTQGVLASLRGGQVGARANQTSVVDSMAALLAELELIFPGVRAAFQQNSAMRMHWPTSPFSRGSTSCYRPGQWAMRNTIGRREGNLHFCGEHCSLDFPARMEGAAETSALVAAEILEDLELPLSAELNTIMDFKRAVPQPGYRDGDTRTQGILVRLGIVEKAHAPMPKPPDDL